MRKFLVQSPVWHTVAWIGIYVVLVGIGDWLSELAGVPNSVTTVLLVALSAFLILYLRRDGWLSYHGVRSLRRSDIDGTLLYLPLVLIALVAIFNFRSFKEAIASGKAARGPRRARLQLRHIDTFSALKISLVLSIAMFFIWMVAVGILYGALSGLGVFDTLNDLFGQLGTASGADGRSEVITPGIVFGGAAVIGAINIVLMTALCTVAAFIYNMCSDLVGGLEVTLSERD